MKKFGLECEYFVASEVNDDEIKLVDLIPQSIPKDSCYMLAEARGEPFEDITKAVFSLKADEYKIQKIAKEEKLVLVKRPVCKVSKLIRLNAAMHQEKIGEKIYNLYGHRGHKSTMSELCAGLHISVTNTDTIRRRKKGNIDIDKLWDFVGFVKLLDEAFSDEIKKSKRNKGFYKIKYLSEYVTRFEYRSLPNNIDLYKLIDILETYGSDK